MSKQQGCRFVAAVPECARARFEEIFAAIGLEPDALCLNGAEAIEEAKEGHMLLLTTYRLADMTGPELAKALGEGADVLMIVPGDYDESEAEGSGALLLRNPISQDALYQAIRATKHVQEKMLAYKKRAEKSERVLEERKVIDRAKGRLIDEMHMSESQAHHYIQKRSMDAGRRIVDVAREILEADALDAEA